MLTIRSISDDLFPQAYISRDIVLQGSIENSCARTGIDRPRAKREKVLYNIRLYIDGR